MFTIKHFIVGLLALAISLLALNFILDYFGWTNVLYRPYNTFVNRGQSQGS